MKSWKIYSIVVTIILVLVIISLCTYLFIFRENITEEEAKNIAFNYANVDKSTITISYINKDIEDRMYEIHFFDNTYEYEVDVNYNNGDIRNYEKDIRPNSNNSVTTATTNTNTNTINNNDSTSNTSNTVVVPNSNSTNISPSAKDVYIGVERIREIVAEHAGLNYNDLKFSKTDLDVDHNIAVYEVEFYYNNLEYDYEVNALTGEILKYEQSR